MDLMLAAQDTWRTDRDMPSRLRAPTGREIGALLALAAALASAYALKRHYSSASADQLGWMLAPTTALVELFTGGGFVPEPGIGYLSTRLRFAIAPSCAGVNFLIAAFAGLVLLYIRPHRPAAHNAAILAASAAAAYLATLAANTVRIVIAIPLHTHQVALGPLRGGELHRLEGIVVYLVALLVLFLVARRLSGPNRHPTRRLGWLLAPLGCYLAITLLVPLVSGAARSPAYWQHAWVVLAATAAAALVTLLGAYLLRGPRGDQGWPSTRS
jgi:exosortase K